MEHRSLELTRRGALATGAAVVLAGCLDGDEGADEDGEDLHSGTADGEFLEHSGADPEPYPEEYRCDGLCGMEVADWPRWNAQLAHETGEALFFCSPGDMLIYVQDPAGHSAIESDITAAWVTEFTGDHEEGDTIDATTAHYVLDYDEDRYDEPMNNNPRPFADRADAVSFVEQYDDLTEDDIIAYEDFDRDLVDPYSVHRIPPWEQ